MLNRSKPHHGIADFAVARRKSRSNFLDKVDLAINWEPVSKFLNKKLARKANAVGNPAYPALVMFKILLLQKWYKLSDVGIEDMLVDHLGFIRFVGLSVEHDVPDATTICRFRNGLVTLKVYDELNTMIINQLAGYGLVVREGVIFDATIVESACHPSKTVDILPEDRKEDDIQNNNIIEHVESKQAEKIQPNENKPKAEITYSKDKEAAWITKGKKSYYGYKHHIAVDDEFGFFLGGHTTAANKSDIGEFKKLVEEIELEDGATIFADKGYTSVNNRKYLEKNNLNDGIMLKATKNKKLTEIDKFINREISKFRYKVERCIGNFKQHYDLKRSRYIGTAKVEAELFMVGIAFNIKKSTNFLK